MITIDEAIGILHQDLGADTYDKYPGLYTAQKLALEALKYVRHNRKPGHGQLHGCLPGEDREEMP